MGRGRGGGGDKPVATRIEPAPKGSAVFETIEPEVRRGVCVARLVFGRAGGSGGSFGGGAGGRGDRDGGTNGAVSFEPRPDEPEYVPPEEAAPAAAAEGPEGDVEEEVAATEETSDAPAATEGTVEGAAVSAAGSKKEKKPSPSAARPPSRSPTLPFSRAGLADAKTNPRPGDVVTFQIRVDRRTKRRGACNVAVVRHKGVVRGVKGGGSYGFVVHFDDGAVLEELPEGEAGD